MSYYLLEDVDKRWTFMDLERLSEILTIAQYGEDYSGIDVAETELEICDMELGVIHTHSGYRIVRVVRA